MSYEAYSWPEATITVIPGDNRSPFVLGYAQGMRAQRTFVRAVDGEVVRAMDHLSIDAIWVDDDVYAYLKSPAIGEWVVEYNNEDGRLFVDRWEDVEIKSVDRQGSLEDGVIRLSIDAEGEPVLN
jgi:hypothetical protein